MRTGCNLAAELTDLIQFVINGRLYHPLVLVRHRRDVLQVEVRQKVIGNLVAHHGAVGFLIVNKHAERQDRNNLFIQGAQYAKFITGARRDSRGVTLTSRLEAERAVAKQRQRQQTDVQQQRQQDVLQCIKQQGAKRHLPHQTHAG